MNGSGYYMRKWRLFFLQFKLPLLGFIFICSSSFLLLHLLSPSQPLIDVGNPPIVQHSNPSHCSGSSVFVYQLSNKHRRFHSNHWFHLCEYYLSRIHQIHSWRDKVAAIDQQNEEEEVVVAVNSPKFLEHITPMTVFLLTLSFKYYSDSVKKVTVVFPSEQYTIFSRSNTDDANGNTTTIVWNNQYSIFSYNNVSLYEQQYRTQKPRFQFRSKSSKVECATFMGSFGDYPIPSDSWFRHKVDVNRVRQSIAQMCPLVHHPIPHTLLKGHIFQWARNRLVGLTESAPIRDKPGRFSGTTSENNVNVTTFKLVVYQRDLNRRFVDLEGILRKLTAAQSTTPQHQYAWTIKVIRHHELIHPCVYYDVLRDADFYLTTHGFQSIAMLFMKPGAVLFEVFPFKYYKRSYIFLASKYGIHHRWTQNQNPASYSRLPLKFASQSYCMRHRRCRSFARGDAVLLTDSDISSIVDTMHDVEIGNLSSYNAPYVYRS